jgi:hypothetical protein
MEEKKHRGIWCNSGCDPILTRGIRVSDNCNTNTESLIQIDTHWSDRVSGNNTAADDFFTRAEKFTVKEIEALKIAD